MILSDSSAWFAGFLSSLKLLKILLLVFFAISVVFYFNASYVFPPAKTAGFTSWPVRYKSVATKACTVIRPQSDESSK